MNKCKLFLIDFSIDIFLIGFLLSGFIFGINWMVYLYGAYVVVFALYSLLFYNKDVSHILFDRFKFSFPKVSIIGNIIFDVIFLIILLWFNAFILFLFQLVYLLNKIALFQEYERRKKHE